MSIRHLRGNVPLGFRELLHEMLSHSVRDYSRSEMLKRICASLLRFSGSDVLSIRIDENGATTRCRATINPDGTDHVEIFNSREGSAPESATPQDPISEPILEAILSGSFSAAAQSFTTGRSFWTSDSARPILLHKEPEADPANRTVVIGGEFASLAVVLIPLSNTSRGVLFLASRRHDFFTKEDIQAYEAIAETLGFALDHQGTQWALRERVKELTCLYGIASVAGRPGLNLDESLVEIVDLLPPGWQYPELTSARITLDGREYSSKGFKAGPQSQSADIGVADQQRGTIEVFYSQRMPEAFEGPFLQEERNLLNAIAEIIGRRVAHHEAQWALRERVKELTCLYGIAQAASRHPFHLDRFFEEVSRLLPPGWQYPGITEARVTFDGHSYATPGWQKSSYSQQAPIVVDQAERGTIEVLYTHKMPDAAEGPFLKEERALINEIARQVGFAIERWEAEQETARLQEQLRHADRLATIGELSAGVAHELNEPMAAMLGFAQLLKESPSLPAQAQRDADKIVNAALHAREVIRKLMIFTRQMPAQKCECDLGQLVKEGLYFLESRCAKENITIKRDVEDGLPAIIADRSQLYQVLVNLVVNAIQAMPKGGTLTISTRSDKANVYLKVADTGIGMSPEVQKQLFTPFFTTKEVGQGTGLGLAVVQGIVTGHGGTIRVNSEEGRGSAFEVRIPLGGGSPAGGAS